MKKALFFIVTALLIQLCCGCVAAPQSTAPSIGNTTPIVSTDPTASTTEHEVSQLPMVAISLPVFTNTRYADDGTAMVQQKYQDIALTIPDADVADSVIIDFLNRTNQNEATIEELYASAMMAYTNAANWSPYLLQTTYAPKRIDLGILSLFGENVIFTGNSHPETNYTAVTYDLTTGVSLTTADILVNSSSMHQLTNLVINTLESMRDETMLYDGYEETVKSALPYSQNWYFTEQGLVFFFSPYEIGPYASGVITAELPYEQLPEILQDAYFPAEKDTASGILLATPFNVDAANTLSQSTEIICQNAQHQIILQTDTSLADLKIIMTDDYSHHTIFATATLTPGDGVILHMSTDDSLHVQYTSNGTTIYNKLQVDSRGNISLS